VLASIDSPGKTLHERMGMVQGALTPSPAGEVDEESWALASQQVEELVRRRGWRVKPATRGWPLLVHVLATFHVLGQDELAGLLDDYAEAAERLAEVDVDCVLRRPDVESLLEAVAVGTVLGDALLAALRRLARANVSARTTPKVARARATAARRKPQS